MLRCQISYVGPWEDVAGNPLFVVEGNYINVLAETPPPHLHFPPRDKYIKVTQVVFTGDTLMLELVPFLCF